MKKYILLIITIMACWACSEKGLLQYGDEASVQFGPDIKNIYSTSSKDYLHKEFSFAYLSEKEEEGVVYFNVYAIGGSRDYDRRILFDQISIDSLQQGEKEAKKGVNYIDFNSTEINSKYILKAGETYMQIPIILKRPAKNDENVYILRLRLKESEDFLLGDVNQLEVEIKFSSKFQKPAYWNPVISVYFLGDYSRYKLQLMMEATGLQWDDKCWQALSKDGSLNFWISQCKLYLAKVNRERNERGEGPLLDDNGKEMIIPFNF